MGDDEKLLKETVEYTQVRYVGKTKPPKAINNEFWHVASTCEVIIYAKSGFRSL
jgi:hypothetical protein